MNNKRNELKYNNKIFYFFTVNTLLLFASHNTDGDNWLFPFLSATLSVFPSRSHIIILSWEMLLLCRIHLNKKPRLHFRILRSIPAK